MVATRNTFRSDTPGPISGDDFLDQVIETFDPIPTDYRNDQYWT